VCRSRGCLRQRCSAGPTIGSRQPDILEAAAHFDAGDLRVQVGAMFPLERAADAHQALQAGHVIGNAVLTMS
jgi:NADPH:quinone reductase-like Zn-dependent oxidoreductase